MDEKIAIKLPAPNACDCCKSTNIKFVNNSEIYGKEYGVWPFGYFCFDCRAYVGCHPDTEIPLGKMATSAKRRLRSMLHGVFDMIWKSGYMSRTDAYNWLAEQLEIEHEECHISWLSFQQLKQAIKICNAKWPEVEKIMLKRKKKRHVRNVKRSERERSTIERRKYFT